jgi:hypothetical protein
MSVATTLRSPPVVEYSATKATVVTMPSRLLVVAVAASSPVTPECSSRPSMTTCARSPSYTPAGSQSCQGRNTSKMRVAATSTNAITVQLMTVP